MEAMNEMVAVRRTPTARWRPRRASGVRESPAAGSTYARELTLDCGKRSRRRRVELMDRDDVAYEGQREYTPAFLRIYDLLILGFFAPVVWRCPTTRLVEGYRRHVGHRHLDVGPGTGYFLARAGMPDGSPVTLLDPNVHVLVYASRRLQRLDITTIEADVCKPLPVHGPFDSAALNGVLHCLPGPLSRKATAVANVADVLAPTGVLFGASILGDSGRHPVIPQRSQGQQPAGHLRQPWRHPGRPPRDP
jgi:SAM-dependent methyltransferase